MAMRSARSVNARRWWLIAGALLLLALPVATPAAAQPAPDAESDAEIRMARPTWDTGWFQAEIYKQLLTNLGYEVSGPETMENEQFYQAAAAGEVDLWASGWFPLHQQYLDDDAIGEQLETVGTEVEAGALQGYFMDSATAGERGITNVEALRDPEVAALFDVDDNGKADLIGCNIEWACADIIDQHLVDYELTDTVEQIQGDYSLLMRESVDRYTAGEPVLFYTFTPNWTVGELVPGATCAGSRHPSRADRKGSRFHPRAPRSPG
ncbi:hypothetical protein BH23ACT10_BH23ACT10_21830 [soil metagenome]